MISRRICPFILLCCLSVLVIEDLWEKWHIEHEKRTTHSNARLLSAYTFLIVIYIHLIVALKQPNIAIFTKVVHLLVTYPTVTMKLDGALPPEVMSSVTAVLITTGFFDL